MEDLQALVDQGDVAGLLLAVDGLCASREWGRLLDLARRCRDAIEMGRQLWSVATHIDYRLAFEGPGEFAAVVLRPGAGRFALGPLPEVAATTHDYASVAPHCNDPVSLAAFALERVLHGEDLRGQPGLPGAGMPLSLQAWEPGYALPRYRDRSAEFPEPEIAVRHVPLTGPAGSGPARLEPDDAVAALESVVEAWTTESAGRADCAVVEGTARDAVAAVMQPAQTVGLARIEGRDALAILQWCGASGGAYGRRRGGASGRFTAWWTLCALTGLEWEPLEAFADELGSALGELDWFRWSAETPDVGWHLRLAVADPADGLAWAIDASDRREDPLSGPSTPEGASGGTP